LTGYQELLLKQELPGGRAVGVTAQLVEERHEGKVRIVAGAKDVISIDGKVVGTGVWEGVLPSGPHAVHVAAQGKRPYRTDALVKDAEVTSLHVNLEDEARPVAAAGVPAWVWVAGGAAVVGAGVGAYFLFAKDEEPGYRDPQVGTWGAIDL
ncbi:MAG: hypothetical protein FJ104_01915, partial [Deltaproteobacteria bacterium]|nr:hypothetical protein [Deltaproteobacteria bacterium]